MHNTNTAYEEIYKFKQLSVVQSVRTEGNSIDGRIIFDRLMLAHQKDSLFTICKTAESLHDYIARQIFKEKYMRAVHTATEQELSAIKLKYLDAYLPATREAYTVD